MHDTTWMNGQKKRPQLYEQDTSYSQIWCIGDCELS